MTSRSSYSDRKEGSGASYLSLIRENLKRRVWSAALSALLFFFMFPVPMLANITSRLNERNFTGYADAAAQRDLAAQRVFEDFVSWSGVFSGGLSFVLCCLAVVIGVSAFSWLHNQRKTDFYHSLPVSRTRLFHVVNINSILIVGIPYFIMCLAAALIVQANTGITGCIVAALSGFAGQMAFFLLAYMTVVLAMMLTGSVFVGILGTFVFFTYGPALFTLIHGLMGSYFRTYYQSVDHIMILLQRTSPFAWMLDLAGGVSSSGGIQNLPGSGLSRIYAGLQASVLFRIWTALAAAVVLMLISLFLYHRRRSEAAGHAMAFAATEAPIKLMICIPVAVTGAYLFHQILDEDAWALFGLVSAALISCLVMEIIFRFDFRQALSHKAHPVICILLAAVFFALFRFDFMGYDTYLPARVSVGSVGITSPALDEAFNYNRSYRLEKNSDGTSYVRQDTDPDPALTVMNRMTCHDLDNAYRIAEVCIADLKKSHRSMLFAADYSERTPGSVPYDAASYYGNVCICWHLADGRTCLRRYNTDLSMLRTELDRLHDDPEYKAGFYPVLGMKPEELSGANYQDISGYEHVRFADPENAAETSDPSGAVPDAAALLQAYQAEFATLTAETRRSEMPVAGLQFKSRDFQAIADWIRTQDGYYGWMNDVDYYPVYPSFVKTIGILEQNGIRLNAALEPEHIGSVVISDSRNFPGLDWEATEAARKAPLVISDREQIREVLDAAVITSLNCQNGMGPVYNGLNVSVRNRTEGIGTDSGSDGASGGASSDESNDEGKNETGNEPVYGASFPEPVPANGQQDIAVAEYTDLKSDTYPSGSSDGYWYDNDGSIEYYAYSLSLDRNRIPAFIIEYFGIDEADIKANSQQSY